MELDSDQDVSTFLLAPGKDEMNFAEHPIALLTDRVPKTQRTLIYEDTVYSPRRKKLVPRKRVIEGSQEYGLPTATDDILILGLIQLTKNKNQFKQPDVEFTRLELIELVGWPNEGKSYKRVNDSLLRIKGVQYFYENAWWDARQKDWTTRAFNILDNVEINDSRITDGQGGLFPSRIKWNEVVFESFQAGFLRNIDFKLCMRLKHPTSLRMYRYLGKQFYAQPELTFELKAFAEANLGLGRNYEGGTQIARKLKPAIQELEDIGFLEPLPEHERFIKNGREWSVRFVQKAVAPPLPAASEPPPEALPLIDALAERGVTRATAAELVQKHPAETIQAKIDVFDWLLSKQDKRVAKNPAGYLCDSIRTDYAVPKGFISRAEREGREEKARQDAQRKAEEKRREQEAADREQEASDHIKWLTPAERADLEAKALAAASPEDRQTYDSPEMAKFRPTLLHMMLKQYVMEHVLHREIETADA